MSLQVVFDESHGEQISVFNHKGLQFLLEKLQIITFRLVSGPLTGDKIINEDILFLGAPTKKFLEFEIKTIEYFVSKGKFLIILCPMPIPYNFSLNELAIKFGMQFQHNVVQDKKHNLSGAMYFPIIKNFENDIITHDIKEIIYSGCSIKKLAPDVKILATSDDHAEPPSAPVVGIAKEGHVVAIGGYTLFQDDNRYGIKAKNNIRFIANIFRSFIQQREQIPNDQKIPKTKKQKFIDPKKAKKYFENLADKVIIDLKKVMVEIDKLYDEIVKHISSQNFPLAEQTLEVRYTQLQKTIQRKYQDLIEKLDDLDSRIKTDINFPESVKEFSNQVLVTESDALSKLDMIRFNLSNRIKNEKLQSEHR